MRKARIIEFPGNERPAERRAVAATVIILPVIHVERESEDARRRRSVRTMLAISELQAAREERELRRRQAITAAYALLPPPSGSP